MADQSSAAPWGDSIVAPPTPKKTVHISEATVRVVDVQVSAPAQAPPSLADRLAATADARHDAIRATRNKRNVRVYRSNEWIKILFGLRNRGLLSIWQPMLLVALCAVGYTPVAVLYASEQTCSSFESARSAFSLVLTALSFLLVFRLNRSATRHYEARQLCGWMMIHSRGALLVATGECPSNPSKPALLAINALNRSESSEASFIRFANHLSALASRFSHCCRRGPRRHLHPLARLPRHPRPALRVRRRLPRGLHAPPVGRRAHGTPSSAASPPAAPQAIATPDTRTLSRASFWSLVV